jgi:hypothetical protein
VFDKTKKFNAQSSTGQLKKLFNNNAQYESNIRSLDKISSAQLEKEWNGSRANLAPDFSKEIERIIAQKKGAGKGLNFARNGKKGKKMKGGSSFIGDAMKPFLDAIMLPARGIAHGVKAIGDVADAGKNLVNTVKNTYNSVKSSLGNNLKGFLAGQGLPLTKGGELSLRGLSDDQLHTIHKKLMSALSTSPATQKRGRGRPPGSKNKKLSQQLRVM